MLKTNSPFVRFCLLFLLQLALVESCLNYDTEANRCLLCPSGMHLYKGNCLYDINQCLEYQNGADCRKCQKGFKVIKSIDRIECRKLQLQQKEDYILQEIDPTLPQNQNPTDRQYFYTFLNNYLTKKYHEDDINCQLIKVVDKLYKNGENQTLMIYKTSEGTIEKTVVKVMENYKSFEVKQTVNATNDDISEEEIVIFDDERLDKNCDSLQSKPEDNIEKHTSQNQPNSDEVMQISDLNYVYLSAEARNKDIGFQTSNQFIRQNNKIIDNETKVVSCFVKTSRLRKNYKIFYKNALEEIYEGQVIYDTVRQRAYILNFGKQFNA